MKDEKSTDKEDSPFQIINKLALNSPDAHVVQNATGQQLRFALTANLDHHSGSAGGNNGDSVQIHMGDGRIASRLSAVTEKQFLESEEVKNAKSISLQELVQKQENEKDPLACSLVGEYEQLLNMRRGPAKDAIEEQLQDKADRIYARGKYASTEKTATQDALYNMDFLKATNDALHTDGKSSTRIASELKVAQASESYMPLPTLIPDFAIRAGIQVLDATENPLAGHGKELLASITKDAPHAWEHAIDSFSQQITPTVINIMKAYTINEINHYDRFDWIDDVLAARGELADTPARTADRATLGLSQISPKGVREFESRYPQLKRFLVEKGYDGAGHEAKALLDPQCVPMIVAAKTASLVEDLHNHGIKNPTTEQLIYAFNPDVYSYPDGQGGKTFKTLYQGDVKLSGIFHHEQQKEYYAKELGVIKASKHIHNVMTELRKIEN